MALRLKVERFLDVTVMEFSGRVTLGEGSVVLREGVREAVWNGHRKLALDYGDISYQDSSGNGEIVSAYTIVANTGGEVILFDLTKRVRDLLQITKLYTVFNVYNSREDALAYFDSKRNPEIKISERRYAHVSVLGIEGALTESCGASKVLTATHSALDAGAESVVLLCPQVLDIDRAGGESLIAASRSVRARGGELIIAGVEERLLPAMSEAGVPETIRMYKTMDEAINVFGLRLDRSQWRFQVVRAV